jgi:cytoskeletal protein CcmA (bactofilin family)
MLQRGDTFFGKRNDKPAERQQRGALDSAPQTTTPNIPPQPTLAADAARSIAKEAPVAPSLKSEDTQGARLLVGPNIKLKGVEITDCDTLIVEGHVEATMNSRLIQITQTGTFSGTVSIDIAEIHGGFSGELTVRDCLTIHKSGKVSGKIRYAKVVIEEGGEISGDIKKISDEDNSFQAQKSLGAKSVSPFAASNG